MSPSSERHRYPGAEPSARTPRHGQHNVDPVDATPDLSGFAGLKRHQLYDAPVPVHPSSFDPPEPAGQTESSPPKRSQTIRFGDQDVVHSYPGAQVDDGGFFHEDWNSNAPLSGVLPSFTLEEDPFLRLSTTPASYPEGFRPTGSSPEELQRSGAGTQHLEHPSAKKYPKRSISDDKDESEYLWRRTENQSDEGSLEGSPELRGIRLYPGPKPSTSRPTADAISTSDGPFTSSQARTTTQPTASNTPKTSDTLHLYVRPKPFPRRPTADAPATSNGRFTSSQPRTTIQPTPSNAPTTSDVQNASPPGPLPKNFERLKHRLYNPPVPPYIPSPDTPGPLAQTESSPPKRSQTIEFGDRDVVHSYSRPDFDYDRRAEYERPDLNVPSSRASSLDLSTYPRHDEEEGEESLWGRGGSDGEDEIVPEGSRRGVRLPRREAGVDPTDSPPKEREGARDDFEEGESLWRLRESPSDEESEIELEETFKGIRLVKFPHSHPAADDEQVTSSRSTASNMPTTPGMGGSSPEPLNRIESTPPKRSQTIKFEDRDVVHSCARPDFDYDRSAEYERPDLNVPSSRASSLDPSTYPRHDREESLWGRSGSDGEDEIVPEGSRRGVRLPRRESGVDPTGSPPKEREGARGDFEEGESLWRRRGSPSDEESEIELEDPLKGIRLVKFPHDEQVTSSRATASNVPTTPGTEGSSPNSLQSENAGRPLSATVPTDTEG